MVSVIIPCRVTDKLRTLRSIAENIKRSKLDIEIIIERDINQEGANVCRNRGFRRSRGDYLLFCDCDIDWAPDAFELLYNTLKDTDASIGYSYGSYRMGNTIFCHIPFDADLLRKSNYISTMSLIKKEIFTRFDERLKRLMDWDKWLSFLERGIIGVFCGETIFTTKARVEGISHEGKDSHREAERIIRKKYNLKEEEC